MKLGTLLAGCCLLASCAEQPTSEQAAPPALPVATVQTSTQTTYQDYPVAIEGIVNVEIRPQIAGILDRILVDEGAAVRQGQPLFKINDAPYRERLNTALAAQYAAEGALVSAQLEVDKFAPLVQNKVVSDIQLKTAQAALTVAKANLQRAEAEVSSARINLGYTLIKAPVSGYLGRLLIKQGSLIGPTDAQALTQLSDVHQIHTYFSLGEDDFLSFRKQYAGQTLPQKLAHVPPVALVLADQSMFPVRGKVDMVDGQFDKTTGAVTLRATFPNANGLLRSGNTGTIRLALAHPNVLLVPTAATVELQDRVFVYAVGDSNRVSRQAITIQGKSGANYLVSEGVKDGDRIVLQGIDHLQEGQLIQPTQGPKPNAAVAGRVAVQSVQN
ncbi:MULTISPECIES: efflux RND transporter periplasmic adaptor subunit [Spirosoma]|uniref:Efflux RND transporter periplasmic adaptor subunit n=1 Tax=Spirosoma liriopis TaxID=2937440 RepID=A0ABT0HTM1_9BACT|nr:MULTISPECIES: efflux RND transporter periplasmic adaptor subunit [Spirosoma]MCK8495511.1 efflux RND transporter periplasmic adaptor subunit [Spirosoma liriopis]UHG94524.1 efflux RND transporter periplasmic adaptor subunit [Spirosoma oryzicola]